MEGKKVETTEDCVVYDRHGTDFVTKGHQGLLHLLQNGMAEVQFDKRKTPCQIPEKYIREVEQAA